HEGEELPPRLLDAPVPGPARAAAVAVDQAEPRVGFSPFPGDLGAVVGGAVVHHDHFEVGERLAGDGLQAVAQHVTVVVERHHNADARRTHLAAPCARSQPSATGSYARST